MLPFFRKVKTTNRELEQLQSNCAQQFQNIRNCLLVDGAVLADVTLASGSNVIANPLNRQLQGWIITDKQANISVYREAWTSTTITLNASGAGVISLWIY